MNDDRDHKKISATADAGETAESAGNVDKIRDILFGGNMREYELRFAQLEKRIVSENRRLAEDLNARFEQLDAYMRDEFKAQTERLAVEKHERKQSANEQNNDLAEARKTLEQKVADVDDSLSVAAQEIRGRLHEQTTELLELIRRSKDELNENLRDQSAQLRNDKVARKDLANLLQEVALRLKGDFDLPGES